MGIVVETERNWKGRIGAIAEIFVNSRARSARSGKGEIYHRRTFSRIFLGGKFVFHLGRIESLAGEEGLIAPSARRKRSDILSRRFQRCIDRSVQDPRKFVHDTFRTTGTISMILGDLRSPNRSQIAFALVLMAHVSRFDSRRVLNPIVSFIRHYTNGTSRTLPLLLSCYNYCLKIVSNSKILLKRYTAKSYIFYHFVFQEVDLR